MLAFFLAKSENLLPQVIDKSQLFQIQFDLNLSFNNGHCHKAASQKYNERKSRQKGTHLHLGNCVLHGLKAQLCNQESLPC